MSVRSTPRLSFANVASSLALFFALSTGVVYAADEWTGDNIVDGSLTGIDIATNALGTNKIKDENLTAIDLAPDSVDNSEIAANAVHSGEIADESISILDLASGSVGSSEIATSAVGSSEIGFDAVGPSEVAADAIDADEIASDAVGSSEIVSSAVGSSEIASSAVGTSEVANNALTLDDTKGANRNGSISVGAGIPNGRCIHINTSVSGAAVGEAVLFSFRATPPVGMLIIAQNVVSSGRVMVAVCNLTGSPSLAINDLPVKVVTFG